MNKPTISVIGYGSFGKFIVDKLKNDYSFEVFDKSGNAKPSKNIAFVNLNRAAKNKYIVLAIPYSAYKTTLQKISELAPKNAVVIDVCSVKVLPLKAAKKYLRDDIEFVGTHPLFGPQSAQNSLSKHLIVFCTPKSKFSQKLESYLKNKGLKLIHMSAKDHDKQMAQVHALTFFVARGLMKSDLHKNTLTTPSFKKLLDLAELESHHSSALFNTIQSANPYSKTTRSKFIKKLKSLNKQIK